MGELPQGPSKRHREKSSSSPNNKSLISSKTMISNESYHDMASVLSVIGPASKFRTPGVENGSPLQSFLDHLSLLGDSERAGASVTSIAIQAMNDLLVYHVTATDSPNDLKIELLKWVLQTLKQISTTIDLDIENLEREIIIRCIDFCSEKVMNYRTRLSNFIAIILENDPEPEGRLEAQVISKIRGVFCQATADASTSDDATLCCAAYEASKTNEIRKLKHKYRFGSGPLPWFYVHHYIGRLASWHNAVKSLSKAVHKKPELVRSYVVKEVVYDAAFRIRPSTIPSLHGTLSKIPLRLDPDFAMRSIVEITGKSSQESETIFLRNFAKSALKLRPHCECVLAEYFFHYKLRYYRDEARIGCSKPSCYSCALYLNCHPGKIEERSSHGKIYPKWSPPTPLIENREDLNRHVGGILAKMRTKIQRDLHLQLVNKTPWGGQAPDSAAMSAHFSKLTMSS